MMGRSDTPRRYRQFFGVAAFCLLAAAAPVLQGCAVDETVLCPTVHLTADALIHVNSVIDRSTGAEIDTFRILAAKNNGHSYPLRHEVIAHSEGVQLRGDTLVCGVPCAFGSSEGIREYLLDAEGYSAQWDTVDAYYSVHSKKGECPSYSSGGVHIDLQMRK